jgi:replicative DNA helicase
MTAALAQLHEHDRAARLAPHDLAGETHLLAALIEVPEELALVASRLTAQHFYLEPNRRIFEGVLALSAAGRDVNYLTLAGWLSDEGRLQQIGGLVYLNELSFQPFVGGTEELATRIMNLARARELIAAAQQIAAEGYAVTADGVQEYLDAAEQQVFRLAARDDRIEVAPMATASDEAYQRMLSAEARRGQVELPTGLTQLDAKIGGLGRARVTAFASRPGMGKTAIAMGVAESIAMMGEPVLVFSFEMPRWQLAMRMACARAGASTYLGINGWLGDEQRALVLRAKDELKTLPIWIDESPYASLSQMRAKARMVAAKSQRRLGAIVLDYLQLIRPPRGRNVSRDEQLSEVTAGLKAMAKEMDCAVVPLSQLNREVEKRPDKRPMLSDLRESGGIEQDADDVIFIYRAQYYLKEKTPDRDRGCADLIIAKQRNGPTGRVRVAFDAMTTTFSDLPSGREQPEDNDADE